LKPPRQEPIEISTILIVVEAFSIIATLALVGKKRKKNAGESKKIK